jgi:DNA polymerase I-like protein with 3'-5' exonuclease and polymerase domains
MSEHDYSMTFVETFQDAENFLRWLSNSRPWLGTDIETEGLVYGKHRTRLVQFGDRTNGWAIPFEHGGWGGLVQDVFDRYEGRYVFHNAKFDISRLEFEGVRTPKWSQIHDTHVMSFLHDNQEPNRKLKRLAKKYLGIDADKGERELQRYFREQGVFWDTIDLRVPVYWQYACLDTTLTAMLAEKLWQQAQYYPEAYDI